MAKRYAFTLAEVMIVFVIIGVLTAILVPGIFTNSPDPEILKAKKAFNTLTRAVETMTNSGPYDTADGMLDASVFVTDTNAKKRFFCNNLSEILNVKKSDCTQDVVKPEANSSCSSSANELCISINNNKLDYETLQDSIDTTCESWYDSVDGDYNFVTADNVNWGVQLNDYTNTATVTLDGITSPAFYGVVCFDTGRAKNKKYVYGMAVRRDGKVLSGTKLQTLLEDEDDK